MKRNPSCSLQDRCTAVPKQCVSLRTDVSDSEIGLIDMIASLAYACSSTFVAAQEANR